MGERLADEVLAVVNHWPGLQKISFVAHSLGGLVVRYAIGILYERLERLKEENSSHQLEKHAEYHKDSIAGLEPMNFITVATPHLGSRGHRQLPCLCGLPFLERKFRQTAHLIAGRSGDHLFLTDIDEDRPPLLVQMASDSYELKFISALRSFKRRAAYANARCDQLVGRSTSSIRRPCELPKGDHLGADEKYPHIVYIEPETLGDTSCRGSSNVKRQMTDFEEMIKGLNQAPWERIHVNFHKSTQRWIAHSTIAVRCYWLNSDGADVIFHMIDNFNL
uniref:DUF676 domain-containing protein n=1 Tax=Opuntia streptacantha TaxID=393608 RepID=A0A7C9EGV6_OPUST